MSWKCLIVDDESIARDLLEDYVNRIPELQLIGKCASALEASAYLKKGQVDILLLDIQMSHLTGVEFLRALPKKPQTIFTTAYSKYAVESYELGVVDYLLKPIEFTRFYMAINKATGIFQEKSKDAEEDKTSISGNLFVRSDKKDIKIRIEDILTVHAQGAYSLIRTLDHQKIMTLQSLSKLEESLPLNFFRANRSCIVNINHIEYLEGNTVTIGKEKIMISKNKRDEFNNLINSPGNS